MLDRSSESGEFLGLQVGILHTLLIPSLFMFFFSNKGYRISVTLLH